MPVTGTRRQAALVRFQLCLLRFPNPISVQLQSSAGSLGQGRG